MTSSLAFLFGTAFVVGLSGALAPGPVLTATISETLKRGFWAGPLIVLGHALLEILLLVALVAGLGDWLTRPLFQGILGVVGGALLALMGVRMMATARDSVFEALTTTPDRRAALRGPILTGILTSLANPFWSIWWATVGLTYVSMALKRGVLGLGAFYTGHILADLAWYSLVAAAIASGRRILPVRVYMLLFLLCGLALAGLGGYFLGTSIGKVF
jgi:threonine/homoserine/homoserine lactone efflux protein